MEGSPPRPGCFRPLTLLTTLLCLFQAGAALRAITTPPALAAQVALPLGLEFVAGVLWALLFAYACGALLRRTQRAAPDTILLIGVFIMYSVARLLFFAQADYDRQRLPFAVAAGILILSALFLLARRSGDKNGRK
ncbi:MAG: hypothetical protein HXY40_03600 [Chloroflexi bacterium]|nr:hypothetical protein [Chloroflexota bacterium]